MAEFLNGDYRPLLSRGIEEQTCRKFGYKIGKDRQGRDVQIAEYRDADGDVVAQKVKWVEDGKKSFTTIGGGKSMPLYGQHLWDGKGRRVVITEGEVDAMSVAQVFGLSWPVVSLPNGANGAKKAIQGALEWLCGFEQVVLCFDMDEPGRQAASDCATLLPPGKCSIAELPRKDANDMLVAGEVKPLTTAIYQARTYRPDGIVSLSDIRQRVLAEPEMGRPYPFQKLSEATFGRRLGEVIGLGAGTGVGKTDLFTQMIEFDVNTLGVTTGVIYLEQDVGETGRRIAGKAAGKRFHVPDGTWTYEELETTWNALEGTGRLHLYDSFGSMDWGTIKSKIRYMVTALGCEHIYLDHLTALAAAEEDERKALEKIMAEFAGMAHGLRFLGHYVSHLTTPEGKPHEEGGRVMIRHFKGSRALGFWSHFMFGLERDQQSSDPAERGLTTLRCLKDRFTGQATGLTVPLSYDATTGRLSEAEDPQFGEDDGPTDF